MATKINTKSKKVVEHLYQGSEQHREDRKHLAEQALVLRIKLEDDKDSPVNRMPLLHFEKGLYFDMEGGTVTPRQFRNTAEFSSWFKQKADKPEYNHYIRTEKRSDGRGSGWVNRRVNRPELNKIVYNFPPWVSNTLKKMAEDGYPASKIQTITTQLITAAQQVYEEATGHTVLAGAFHTLGNLHLEMYASDIKKDEKGVNRLVRNKYNPDQPGKKYRSTGEADIAALRYDECFKGEVFPATITDFVKEELDFATRENGCVPPNLQVVRKLDGLLYKGLRSQRGWEVILDSQMESFKTWKSNKFQQSAGGQYVRDYTDAQSAKAKLAKMEEILGVKNHDAAKITQFTNYLMQFQGVPQKFYNDVYDRVYAAMLYEDEVPDAVRFCKIYKKSDPLKVICHMGRNRAAYGRRIDRGSLLDPLNVASELKKGKELAQHLPAGLKGMGTILGGPLGLIMGALALPAVMTSGKDEGSQNASLAHTMITQPTIIEDIVTGIDMDI